MSGLRASLANQTLRQFLEFLNMSVMHQPEIYLGKGDCLIDSNGTVVEGSEKFFIQVMKSCADWVVQILKS